MNNIQNNAKSDISSFTKQAIGNAMRDLHVCKVGKIENFNSSNQTATITLMIQAVMTDGSAQDMPLLVDVPVLVLQGSRGYLNMPIQVGDPCIVIFCDRDIDNWFVTGQKQPPATPVLHNIKDGFAIVGFNNLENAFSDYDDSFSLKYKQAQLGISESGKLFAKNSVTSLLQVLTQLIQALLQMQIVTQGQAFVASNTPGVINTATATSLQQVLQKLEDLME